MEIIDAKSAETIKNPHNGKAPRPTEAVKLL